MSDSTIREAHTQVSVEIVVVNRATTATPGWCTQASDVSEPGEEGDRAWDAEHAADGEGDQQPVGERWGRS